ncbi:MAG TPA: DsbE family thiol:disulfide interchange protein [Burkholderiaceae bacterium]
MRRIAIFLVPLAAFTALFYFLWRGLSLTPSEVPSPFIGKPAPAFTLTQLADPQLNFSPKDMQGKVWLLNVWASWCPACRDEHPMLVEFSRQNIVPIVGLDYRDQRDKGAEMLQQLGNPYQLIAFDGDGRVAIDYGVYGAPETFLIDKHGVIRYKQIGPITPEVLAKTLLPKIKELENNA